MENNQADPANPILNTKGPCFVTLNEGLKRETAYSTKEPFQISSINAQSFPPGIWFFWEGVVFSRVYQPLRYTLVGWYPVFVSWTEISGPLSVVSLLWKKGHCFRAPKGRPYRGLERAWVCSKQSMCLWCEGYTTILVSFTFFKMQ